MFDMTIQNRIMNAINGFLPIASGGYLYLQPSPNRHKITTSFDGLYWPALFIMGLGISH